MLFNKITHLPDISVLFVNEEKSYTVGDIKEFREYNIGLLKSFNDEVVALQFQKNIDLAKWLILLDGVASSILILPYDIEESTTNTFLEQTKCKFVLSENKTESYNLIIDEIKKVKSTWLIPTSGTTSKPKLVSHNINSLTNTLKIGSSKFIWASLYDLNRFSGIQVFLQAVCSGNKLVIKESPTSLTKVISLFEKEKVDCMSGTPTFFRKLLMVKNFLKLPLKSISLGGEIVDQKLLSCLKNSFNEVKIRHIYASTEAGVGFSVSDGFSGFPLKYLEQGEGSLKLKISPKGTLLIKSGSSASSYISGNLLIDKNGFVDTGDLIDIKGQRCFFLGRASGIINVAGNKVVPEKIEDYLLNIDGIVSVKVYGKNNSFVGQVVCADIVINDNLDTKLIREYCKKGLEVHEQPAFIKIVDEIEITSSGKIKR